MFEVVKVPVSHFLPFIPFFLGLLYVCTAHSSFPLAPCPPVVRAVLRSKTLNGATCTSWLRRFWSSILEGDADCNSNGRPEANP